MLLLYILIIKQVLFISKGIHYIMTDKINIVFTKKQFRTLLDIVYAGNYLISSTNEKDEEKYNEIESLVFSHAKEADMDEFAEYVSEYGGWLPTKKFEEQGIEERIECYDSTSFWNELIHRLALRDVALTLNTDNPDIVMEAILDRTDEYEEFFENNDLSNVTIKNMKPMRKNYETFRSMDIGKVDMYDCDNCTDDDDDEHGCDCGCEHHHTH